MKHRRIAGLAAGIIFPFTALAQSEIEIPARYKGKNAIVAERSEHLVIKMDNGLLQARSYITEERILNTDIAASMYEQDQVYHGSFNKLEDVEGMSFIPDGKGFRKVKATIYKTSNAVSESVFYGDLKKTPVVFSGLVRNAHTKISYTINHEDLHFLPLFTFAETIPSVITTYKVTVPKGIAIGFILKGDNTGRIKKTEEAGKKTTTYTFTATDVPEVEQYPDAPGHTYYIPHIIPYLVSYKAESDLAENTRFFGTVADLNKYFYNFIKDINKEEDEYLNSIVAEVTKLDTEPGEKAKHIYEWVQQNLRYIAYEDSLGGFVPRQAATVCKRKFGDCKDMSSALITMCRTAGIEAHYTWIGTRDKPYKYEEVPLPVACNHMICTIKIGDEWIFLDGTDNTIPFGVPTAFIQGKEALINLGPNSYKIIRVPEMDPGQNVISDTTLIHISDRDISGSIKAHYEGYPAWQMTGYINMHNDKEKKDEIKRILGRGSNKFIQETASATPESDKSLVLTSDFVVKDYLQANGDELYVNLNLQRSYADEWVDTSKRTVPISYKYKNLLRQVVVFDIPEGYEVKYLPPADKKRAADLLGYSINYYSAGNKVTLVKEMNLSTMMIDPEHFSEYNRVVEALKKNYKESLVLKSVKK